MVWKSGEFHRRGFAVGAACECDAENLTRRYCVFRKSLVKISDTEKEHRIGVLLFHLGVLCHQRCLRNLLCHYIGSSLSDQTAIPT